MLAQQRPAITPLPGSVVAMHSQDPWPNRLSGGAETSNNPVVLAVQRRLVVYGFRLGAERGLEASRGLFEIGRKARDW